MQVLCVTVWSHSVSSRMQGQTRPEEKDPFLTQSAE